MKKLILILIPLVFFSFTNTQIEKDFSTTETEMSEKDEREFLLNYFQQTTENLQKQMAGLSATQMQYKASEEQWSVSQVLEHIIITEKMLFGMLQEQMLKPANPERKSEITVSDDDILSSIKDRSRKFKASAELEGKNDYTDPEKAIKDLTEQRKQVFNYINDTPVEEMRNRVNDSPMGPVDVYQFALFIAGHTARHTLQIEELMASEGFPSE